MNTVEWTDELLTGHPDIDKDHRELFALLERLHHDTRDGLVNTNTAAVVDALRDYAEHHFLREEAAMRRIGYSDYAAHKTEHARFVSELGALQSRLERGARTPQLDIDQLLGGWLRRHVLVMDKALAAAIAAS